MSVSSNHLVTFPASPSLSCCRILLDQNPRLHHLPYLLGCQQTILEYSNQAAWAASSSLARDTMDGVWNLKLSGCDLEDEAEEDEKGEEDEEEEFPIIVTQSGKRLRFSDRLKCIWNTAEMKVCSLKELCLKAVYSQVEGRLVLRLRLSEDVRLHLPSLYTDYSGSLTLADLRSQLPGEVWDILRSGPISHCCSPSCCRPIFQEAEIEILESPVQTGWRGGGGGGLTTFLASRLYCQSACYFSHRHQPSHPWEKIWHSREIACRTEK